MIPYTIGLWSPAPGCGKSTVAEIIRQRSNAQIVPFADTLRQMLKPLLFAAGYSPSEVHHALCTAEGKQERLYHIPGMPTARDLMQTLGTEWGRFRINQELWVAMWTAKVRHAGGMRIIADDVRFPNEAAAIRAMGGQLWCITSNRCITSSDHISEGQLGNQPFDVIIQNNGSLDDLRTAVAEVLNHG